LGNCAAVKLETAKPIKKVSTGNAKHTPLRGLAQITNADKAWVDLSAGIKARLKFTMMLPLTLAGLLGPVCVVSAALSLRLLNAERHYPTAIKATQEATPRSLKNSAKNAG
jgi:nitrate reductase beta subunit